MISFGLPVSCRAITKSYVTAHGYCNSRMTTKEVMACFVLKKTTKFSVLEIPSPASLGGKGGSAGAHDSRDDDKASPAGITCLVEPEVHPLWAAMEEARQKFSVQIGLLQVESLAHNALEAKHNAALAELRRARAREQDAFYQSVVRPLKKELARSKRKGKRLVDIATTLRTAAQAAELYYFQSLAGADYLQERSAMEPELLPPIRFEWPLVLNNGMDDSVPRLIANENAAVRELCSLGPFSEDEAREALAQAYADANAAANLLFEQHSAAHGVVSLVCSIFNYIRILRYQPCYSCTHA